MKIVISPGHEPDNPGAKRGLVNEYGLSSQGVGYMVGILGKMGHEVWLIGADSNKAQVKRINQLKADIGLELHFNSHKSPEIHGTETLHSGAEKGRRLAFDINNSLVERLQTHDRGTHVGHYRRDVSKKIIEMIRDTNCPFVVIEPLFLSNDDDFSRIDLKGISIAIADGIQKYAEE